MNVRPRSLFGRTAITIASTLLAFMLLAAGAAAYFIYLPMAQRYADDFAADIVSAAHQLQDLPIEMHDDLKRGLLLDHGLIVADAPGDLGAVPLGASRQPFFEQALERRAGEPLQAFSAENEPLIWVDVPAHDSIYRIGFDKERLGINPPVALLVSMLVAVALTLAASLLEVRRVVRPLQRLSSAAEQVGRGLLPPQLPTDGPEEIAALARTFNRMSSDLRELAENRTTMLAGISHDLRTPMTRMAITVEMLDEQSDPELVARLRRDLEAMDKLIDQFLQFSRGSDDERPQRIDLRQMLDKLNQELGDDGAELRLHCSDAGCVIDAEALALERVLTNLLKNASQYSDGQPVDIYLDCCADRASVDICDRGPGIPSDQVETVFRPFQRLEQARSAHTGGSGLGLAIARQLALKHDWAVDLLPREGGGTVARLSLPSVSCSAPRASRYRA